MQGVHTQRMRRRRGFTLIELLTVVGIIALVIGILLPSLARARSHARRVKIQATLKALEAGVEMFRNDFGEYPPSAVAKDPIVDFPGSNPSMGHEIEGSARLARAMVGHDGLGVDTQGRVLEDGNQPEKRLTVEQLATVGRVGPYIEGLRLVRDNDPRWGEGDRHPPSGRPFVVDGAYEFPLLYYRANPRGRKPFDRDSGQSVYARWDNFGLTGVEDDNGPRGFWDFARTGLNLGCHPIGEFGSIVPDRVTKPPSCAGFGKTFVGFMHEPAARGFGVVRPRNPERFVLIHAGRDGIYGTDDDLTNFK